MPTCALITLGCKVNQWDTEALREDLERRGFVEVAPSEPADLYVVNTCCVTHESHRKSVRHVRRLARAHPGAALVVVGCSVEHSAEAFLAIPGVGCVGTNAEKPGIGAVAARLVGLEGTPAEPAEASQWPSISRFAGHTRAFVKVEDGCNDFCSYCIVPHVRGRVRSRPPDEVAAEVTRLVANGYREVVLTGIHLGAYGLGTEGQWTLGALVRRLTATPGLQRLRLSSLELREVSDELIELAAASHVLCPHFHIPLQSGDDAVLHAMNRRYTGADYLARVDAIRRRIDDAAITADAIVGFPGETDEQFRHTIALARQAAFGRMHVFPYSDREGTPAASMPHKTPRAVIKERRAEMLGVAAELATAYHRRFVGRTVEPLIENSRDHRTGLLVGYTERYVRVFLDGPDELLGRIVPVRVTETLARGVRGEGGT